MYEREIGLKVRHSLWERDDLGSNPRSLIFWLILFPSILIIQFVFEEKKKKKKNNS